MKEKILQNKKNGMAVMLLLIALYILSVAGFILGVYMSSYGNALAPVVITVSILWFSLGWIFFCGLKVLKPQEALVLTLFGKYVGTIKNEGFYYVNPFCTAVNPAARTKLKQSGDVDGAKSLGGFVMNGQGAAVEFAEKHTWSARGQPSSAAIASRQRSTVREASSAPADAPRPALPSDPSATATASTTSCGLRIVVAALSR